MGWGNLSIQVFQACNLNILLAGYHAHVYFIILLACVRACKHVRCFLFVIENSRKISIQKNDLISSNLSIHKIASIYDRFFELILEIDGWIDVCVN